MATIVNSTRRLLKPLKRVIDLNSRTVMSIDKAVGQISKKLSMSKKGGRKSRKDKKGRKSRKNH